MSWRAAVTSHYSLPLSLSFSLSLSLSSSLSLSLSLSSSLSLSLSLPSLYHSLTLSLSRSRRHSPPSLSLARAGTPPPPPRSLFISLSRFLSPSLSVSLSPFLFSFHSLYPAAFDLNILEDLCTEQPNINLTLCEGYLTCSPKAFLCPAYHFCSCKPQCPTLFCVVHFGE